MSRQAKGRNKARIAVEMTARRLARRAALSPEQVKLRREQARILNEAKLAERIRVRQDRERELREKREKEAAKLQRAQLAREEKKRPARTIKTLSRPSSVISEVHPEGTILKMSGVTVITRKSVHVKTYPAGAMVRFLGNGRQAVIALTTGEAFLLDLETGQDQKIDPVAVAEGKIPVQISLN